MWKVLRKSINSEFMNFLLSIFFYAGRGGGVTWTMSKIP